MFRRTIGGVVRDSMKSSDRRKIDNVTGLVRQHQADLLLHAPEEAKDVDLDHLLELLGRCVPKFHTFGRDANTREQMISNLSEMVSFQATALPTQRC